MLNEPYEKMLEEYLRGEFRVLNAHIPIQPKPLSALLAEEYPAVTAKDGNVYLLKKKELLFLASFLSKNECEALLLPIMIEVIPGQDEIAVITKGDVEAKVVSHLLDMPVIVRGNRIKLYKPHLTELRKVLRTATQYIFSPRLPEGPTSAS